MYLGQDEYPQSGAIPANPYQGEVFGRMELERNWGPWGPGGEVQGLWAANYGWNPQLLFNPRLIRTYLGDDSISVFTAPPEPVETMPMPIPTELEYPPEPAPASTFPLSLVLTGLSLLLFHGKRKR
jgi:hypothetical protein